MTDLHSAVRAVAWDMDGTLVNTEPLWGQATFEMSEEMGRRLTPEQRALTVGGTSESTISFCLENAGFRATPGAISRWRRWFFDRVAELLDGGFEFRPGVPRILQELKEAGIPQALVTNTERELVDHCLPVIGSDYFTATIAGDEVPAGKPAPDGYTRAAAKLGVPVHNLLVVEDSHTGMLAGLRAGARVLGVPSEPDVEVSEAVSTLAALHYGAVDFAQVSAVDLLQIGSRCQPAAAGVAE